MCTEEISEYRDENNNVEKSIDLNTFDSELGYYQQVIRPLLAPGHDCELIFWLKTTGMIPNVQVCKNSKNNENCNKTMAWFPSRNQDFYQWKCNNCLVKKSIRDGSMFCDVKCNFKNALRILLGWSKCNDFENIAAMLGIKNCVVSGLYNTSAQLAEEYIQKNITEFQIGGPGSIILFDIYPTGFGPTSRSFRPILCLAEVKTMPQKYWYQSLERNRPTQNKEKILKVIQQIVKPGSVLVVPSESQLCSYADFLPLKNLYPTIVTVGCLKRHNTPQTTCEENLEIIWKQASNVCAQAQLYNNNNVQQYLTSQMWHQRFGNEAFERLLHQFSIY
ncbi:unnamed protein product [Brassicogethes aeneus]|uniref:Uncharacterized protein n=1 Tax=Brassicogethes aeneus TaxID=1431903 RepID=A0A9P0B3N1_BRAAE|nr:unnamed protein product [Brassicogethes aeneus]